MPWVGGNPGTRFGASRTGLRIGMGVPGFAVGLAEQQGDVGLMAQPRAHRGRYEGYTAPRDGVDDGTL